MQEAAPSPFGLLLRQYRLAAGLTQAELAERAGISTDAISTLERGARRSPHRDTIRLLTDALELASQDRTIFEEAALKVAAPVAAGPRALDTPPSGNFLGALPSGPLVSREEELDRIESILEAVAHGAGQLVLVAGELGAGKTRLAQEAMAEASSRSFVLGVGRCYQADESTPCYPILEALVGMAKSAPLGMLADLQRRGQEIRRMVSSETTASGSLKAGLEGQHRLFAAITEYLSMVARVLPVALLLDDLHWADVGTVELLKHLAHATRTNRVLLLGTLRDVRLSEEHPTLTQVLQDLGRERLVERITVRRLSAEETAAMVAAIMGEVSEEFAAFIHRRTKGNPRFIDQMVRSLGGRLCLVREIGAGAMGRVFEAEDSQTGKRVAAKLMLARGGVDADALVRFQQEGAVLGALTHPNVVDIYDTFVEEHASCIIMELLDGPSLGQMLRAGPLPLPRAKGILLQVAAALEYAHAHGIAHRDIKPDNIMVVGDDHAKVTDFGIARILRPDATLQTIATTGMRVGTPLYMSPEQIEGKKIDGRADIYSLGAVMYHAVTGRPPFEGDDPLAIAIKHLREEPQSPSELNTDLPADWEEVILKALAKDPAERFQTASDMKVAIDALGVAPTNRPMEASRQAGTTRHKLPHVPFFIPVVGSLIVALVIAVILLRVHPSGGTATHAASCVPALVTAAYYNPLDDALNTGFLQAAAKLEVKNPPMYRVQPTGDYAAQLRRAATQHPCVVVVGGLLQTNVLTGVSAQYTKAHFVLVDAVTLDPVGTGFVNRPNVEDLDFQTQESGYLVGYLAGLMEKGKVGKATHGVIGVMGGIPEPQVDVYMHGYTQGAHTAYPRIKILSAYSHSFVDQESAKVIGLDQIAHGADILFGVAGDASLGYMAAARQRGVYAIGVDQDQSSLGEYVLTSALKNYDTAVYAAIMGAAQHHFKGGIQPIGLLQNGTGFAKPSRIVPASIVAMVQAQARKIAGGQVTPQS